MFVQVLILLIFNNVELMVDFRSSDASDWFIINDGVMGGLSEGRAIETKEGVLFYGKVSLENNGGFSSFRSPWQQYDLTDFTQVTVRYRSQGIRKALVMETDRRFYVPNYKVSLPNAEEWTKVTFQLTDFKKYRLGNPLGSNLQEDTKDQIIRIGFITDEKRAGDFKFEVSQIEFQ